MKPEPVGSVPGVQFTPGREAPQFLVILLAREAYMSGTRVAFDLGPVQPVAVPPAKDFVELPSWPLQSTLVLVRIEQPDRFTIGDPFKVNETCELGCPWSSVSMQELSPSAI